MKINNITVVGSIVKYYKVGDRIGEQAIYEIENKTLEYPDHIFSLYYCLNHKREILVQIENCSVVVEYEKDNQKI